MHLLTLHSLLRRSGLVACVGLSFVAFPCSLWAADANQAQSYALRLPLTTVAGAALQRLELPAQVLAGLQTADYRDIRIFNAQGQPVPMALGVSGGGEGAATKQETRLLGYPILGAAGAAGNWAQEGLSLRIEEKQGQRVVQINTTGSTPEQATGATPAQQVLGTLFDTRHLGAPVVSLALDADLPPAQAVSFQVDSSRDLTRWTPLASTVLYRAPAQNGGSPAQLGSSTITLTGVDLNDQYLRITWAPAQGGPGALANVVLRGATFTTSRSAAAATRPTVQLKTPALDSPHQLEFALPFATPVAAMGIDIQGNNVLLPVRVLGRHSHQQPWTPLAQAVVYKLQTAGTVQRSGVIPLDARMNNRWREIRIEADAKTPGFAGPPVVSVEFEPVQLVFVASGEAPFTLAAGLQANSSNSGSKGGGASNSFLPLASLVPGYQPGQENSLPLARIVVTEAAAAAAPTTVQAPDLSDTPGTQTMVLWAVLLGGVVALGFMALALLRQTRKADAPEA